MRTWPRAGYGGGLGNKTAKAEEGCPCGCTQGGALQFAHMGPGVSTEGPGVCGASRGTEMLRGQIPGNKESKVGCSGCWVLGDSPQWDETPNWRPGRTKRTASTPVAPPMHSPERPLWHSAAPNLVLGVSQAWLFSGPCEGTTVGGTVTHPRSLCAVGRAQPT